MSSPIDDESPNDRLKYAPPWARQQLASSDTGATPAPPQVEAASHASLHAADSSDHPRDLDLPPQALKMAESPEMAPHSGEPTATWLRAPAKPFEGDRAMRELRARMTLNPHAVPEPPEIESSRAWWKSVWRSLGITIFAVGAAFAVVIYVFPEAKKMMPERPTPVAVMSTSKGDREAAAEASLPAQPAPPSLVVIEKRAAAKNEPVPLGITLTGGAGNGAILLSGLAVGTRVSVGAPIDSGTWRVPLPDLGQAKVIPPEDFTGIMDMTAALLTADAKVADKRGMRLEWGTKEDDIQSSGQSGSRKEIPPSATSLKRSDLLALQREEIEGLVKRGREFIANGDLAAARLVLRRAADGGDAQAALLLGTTFDPATFDKLHVIGAAPDPAEARNWYQRAISLGSAEAERRLAPLASGTR